MYSINAVLFQITSKMILNYVFETFAFQQLLKNVNLKIVYEALILRAICIFFSICK